MMGSSSPNDTGIGVEQSQGPFMFSLSLASYLENMATFLEIPVEQDTQFES